MERVTVFIPDGLRAMRLDRGKVRTRRHYTAPWVKKPFLAGPYYQGGTFGILVTLPVRRLEGDFWSKVVVYHRGVYEITRDGAVGGTYRAFSKLFYPRLALPTNAELKGEPCKAR